MGSYIYNFGYQKLTFWIPMSILGYLKLIIFIIGVSGVTLGFQPWFQTALVIKFTFHHWGIYGIHGGILGVLIGILGVLGGGVLWGTKGWPLGFNMTPQGLGYHWLFISMIVVSVRFLGVPTGIFGVHTSILGVPMGDPWIPMKPLWYQ